MHRGKPTLLFEPWQTGRSWVAFSALRPVLERCEGEVGSVGEEAGELTRLREVRAKRVRGKDRIRLVTCEAKLSVSFAKVFGVTRRVRAGLVVLARPAQLPVRLGSVTGRARERQTGLFVTNVAVHPPVLRAGFDSGLGKDGSGEEKEGAEPSVGELHFTNPSRASAFRARTARSDRPAFSPFRPDGRGSSASESRA